MPTKVRLGDIATMRSGDKGDSSNIGVIARAPEHYDTLLRNLTADRVREFFSPYGVSKVTRYELPNLHALNFILHHALDGGGSVSLRIDAQGKAMGQVLLEAVIDV